MRKRQLKEEKRGVVLLTIDTSTTTSILMLK